MKTKELKRILRDLDSYDFGELFDVASDLISEVAKQNADIAALRAALGAVEWIEYMASETYCPWCNAEPCKGDKHAPDCQRQLALGVTP